MDYFSIGYNAVCLLLQGIMQMSFVGRFTAKPARCWHFIVYLALLGLLTWAAVRLFWPDILSIALQILVLYAVNRLALANRPAAAGTAAILAVYITQLSFGLVNSVTFSLFPYWLGQPLLYLLVMATAAVSFLICGGCYLAVGKLLSLPDDVQTPYLALLILPALFCFASELYILDTAYTNIIVAQVQQESGKHFLLLVVQIMGLATLLCTLYAYRRICRSWQAQAETQALIQAARAQRVYINEARQRYMQTRAFRHDIKNHLAVLAGLLQNEQLAESRAYLQKLEGAAAALSFPYQTGNGVVDILLAEKLGLAAAEGVQAEVELILPESSAVDDFDWCVIFANALDNALNACRLLAGEKSLSVSGERQGDFYMLKFVNSCQTEGGLPPGLGLANIRAAAEKYHGAVQTEKADGQFCLNVLLNIS